MSSYIRIFLYIVVVVAIGVAVARFYPKPVPPPPPVEEPPLIHISPVATTLFVCEAGRTITASFFEGKTAVSTSSNQTIARKGRVELALSGLPDGARTITLPQTEASDGERYATADESFIFSKVGNSAVVLEKNESENFRGCIAAAPLPDGSDLIRVFASSTLGFSLRLPSFTVSTSSESLDAYQVVTGYRYRELGPGKAIPGIKFTIPNNMATGTNLSDDSFISVERLASTSVCTADLFLPGTVSTSTVEDSGITYSFASSTDAAAGNRYEEDVYAFPGTSPCLAVRYFIHYGVYENYPKDTVKEIDLSALRVHFDEIRKSLVVSQ